VGRGNQVHQELLDTNERKPMKLSDASLVGRANVSYNDTSDYEATHKGALNLLEKGRSTATWARVSASVLGEIDDFVQALAGRQP
jgi:myosin-crossreactive antigen